jgi:formylglycine-generating enzyme required for sulfatase activity
MGGSKDNGRGSNGGVWEWTSTPFDAHEGMVPTGLFPGYSTDFFDTKHHVVVGSIHLSLIGGHLLTSKFIAWRILCNYPTYRRQAYCTKLLPTQLPM